MTAERWQHIEQLYHAALERDTKTRAAFLDEACAGNAELHREVEALLAANDQATGFLGTPALEQEAKEIAAEKITARLTPVIGNSLNHYTVLSRIGAGGMGEVWLARDTRLDRQVALKMLPVEFTTDTHRLQRFIREAKAASALNHPNIITIHEIGEAETPDGKTHFIATEFIAGQTLRQRMAAEEWQSREAIAVAIQVAAALDAAHNAGIVHRDIKPENIMVRPDGLVKVLDFGLAKLAAPSGQSSDAINTNAETLPPVLKTQPGMILGTLRYMSPEQARGRDVDARTDIFSLGVVLYEMITRQPLFAGDNSADVIAAIIHKEPPPLTDFAPDSPAELERIVSKALAKDCRDRYQTARDLQIDLQTLKQDSELSAQLARLRTSGSNRISGELKKALPGYSRAASPAFGRWGIVGIAALALLIIAAVAWKMATKSSFPLPRELSFETLFGKKDQDNVLFLQSRFSPRRNIVAFAMADEESSHIWVRQIGSDGEQQITFGKWRDDNPIWSPDDDKIAFVSTRGNQLGIWTTSSLGGTPTPVKTIGDSQALANRGRLRMVAWAKNDPAIYYEWQQNLFRLDLNTKEATPLIEPNAPFQLPQDFSLSPGEQEAVFIARQNGQYDLWKIGLATRKPQQVTNDPAVDQHPLWLSDGRLLYNSTRGEKMQLYTIESSGGEPSPISTSDHQCQLADFSNSTNQILCYEQRDDSDIVAVEVESGTERQLTDDYGVELWSNVSPDGQTLLYQAIPGDRFVSDIRKAQLFTKPVTAKEKATRLSADGDGFDAHWSPDSQQIAFLRLTEQTPRLWTVKASGSDLKELGTDSIYFGGWRNSPPYNRLEARTWDWSPDSKRIAYSSRQKGVANIWVKSIDGSQPVKSSDNNDAKLKLTCPIWSPDGQRLAYVTETDAASDKQIWSVWVNSQGQSGMIFQTETRLRLRGWLAHDHLLVALAENVSGSGAQPATVTLASLAITAEAKTANKQNTLGSLTDIYLSNLHLAPGGGKFAFVKVQNRRHDIWVASVNGNQLGQPRKITNNSDPTFRFANLTWSPDGKTIYYDKQTRWSLLTTSAASR
ncbi:MAG: protein kinase [Blastocatellia bacterium]